MKKGLENFYDSIENIYVCFGGLEELSGITKKSKRNLEIIKTPQLFNGIIIPSLEELKKYSQALFSSLNDFGELDINNINWGVEKLMEFYEEIFSNEKIQNLDIRKKAKKIGADALMGLTYTGESSLSDKNINIKLNSFYGHPVKIKGIAEKFI